MPATCQVPGCNRAPYDNCEVCNKSVCQQHGRKVGDRFVCRECVERSR